MLQCALLIATLIAPGSSFALAARDGGPPPDRTSVGPELRQLALTKPPSALGMKATKEFPSVYGVVMDWPLGDYTVTVVSFSTGDASLYTTAQFGVIGGGGHEGVRAAATRLVRHAASLEKQAKVTSDRSYPPAGRIRFFLLTFRGLKSIEDDQRSIEGGHSKYSALFGRAQEVITEMRMVTEKSRK